MEFFAIPYFFLSLLSRNDTVVYFIVLCVAFFIYLIARYTIDDVAQLPSKQLRIHGGLRPQ